MSVQIILSSKQIELDDKNLGVLNIKATFLGITQPTAVFYKVKTNLKGLVEVRPSFGVISQDFQNDCIATMNIRYLGDMQELKKVKLQFSWVWGSLRGIALQKLNQKKLNHNDFKEFYDGTKQRMGNEKFQLLIFTSKYQSRESQQSLIINQQHKQQQVQNDSQPEEEIQAQKESLAKTRETSANRQKSVENQQKSVKKSEDKGVSGLKVIILVLISFVLGVFLGIKLEDARRSLAQETFFFDKISEIFPMKAQSQEKQALLIIDQIKEKVQSIESQI